MLSASHFRDRVFRSQSAACNTSLFSHCHSRPGKYKPWDDDCMQKALQAVKLDGTSVRKAAMEYGVPKSTLGDRVSGRVTHGVLSGPPKYLSEEDEDELVRFILGCVSVGYPKTRKEILSLVQTQVDKPISHGWWDSFCKRHPNLTFRTPAPLSIARATAVDEDAIGSYFDLLERTLEDNGLLEKPCQIFNMDETGMPLSPQSPKCVFTRGEKNPVNIDGGDKAQITVVACVSAAGYCIPPMVIWDRKKLSLELTAGEVPGTFYGLSDKGWMDQELFDAWLSCHFLRYAPPTRPLLLLLDGHSSHYSPHAIRFAAKEKVIMFTLPPHTTHVTQPLDRGCFSPLKMAWREVCHTFMAQYKLKYPLEGTKKSVIKQNIQTVRENMTELLQKAERKLQETERAKETVNKLKRQLEATTK
jgi:transposase